MSPVLSKVHGHMFSMQDKGFEAKEFPDTLRNSTTVPILSYILPIGAISGTADKYSFFSNNGFRSLTSLTLISTRAVSVFSPSVTSTVNMIMSVGMLSRRRPFLCLTLISPMIRVLLYLVAFSGCF